MASKTKKTTTPKSGTYMGKASNGKPVVVMQYKTHDIQKNAKKGAAPSKQTSVPKKSDKTTAAVAKKSNASTYTVMGKTFATKSEAQAYKALQKQRSGCEIKETKKKPTHKVVTFTAKN